MDVEIFKKELEKTYSLKLDVYTYVDVEENGISYNEKEIKILENIPCTISQKDSYITIQDKVGLASKMVKIFLAPDIIIPVNSRIIINDINYKYSGIASIYDTHQELMVERIENG